MQGQSALSTFGITQFPIGTKDEVLQEGLDPKEVACCSPTQMGICRGCQVAADCRFHLPSMGGFKFSGGPKYIGFRLINPEDRSATEDIMTCHVYTRTMQARSDHGAMQRRKGLPGEIINVIAQEGQEIITRYNVPVNVKGEVVKLPADLFRLFEANGIKVAKSTAEQVTGYEFFDIKRTVPRHPRPGELTGSSYAQRIAERERARAEREEQIEAQAFGMPATADDVLDLSSGDAVPVATPVRKKP